MDSVKSVPTLFGGGNLRGGDYTFNWRGYVFHLESIIFLGGGAFEQEQGRIIGGSASAGGGGAFQNRSRGA